MAGERVAAIQDRLSLTLLGRNAAIFVGKSQFDVCGKTRRNMSVQLEGVILPKSGRVDVDIHVWLEWRRELLAPSVVVTAGQNSDFVAKDLVDKSMFTVDAP